MCGCRSISSLDLRLKSFYSFYRQELTVTSYHDLAMSVVMIHCHRSYHKEQWMTVVVVVTEEDFVTHGRTTSRKEQAS